MNPDEFADMAARIILLIFALGFGFFGVWIYTFLTTNGVNWDCPNQEARTAMERYHPNVMCASDCLDACQQAADAEKRDLNCRCPTSDGKQCVEWLVSPMIHHSYTGWKP